MREYYLVPRALAEKYCGNDTTTTTTSSDLPVELKVKRPKKRRTPKTKDTQGILRLIDVKIPKELRATARALLDYLAPNPLLQWNERGDLGGVLEGHNIINVLLYTLTKAQSRKDREKLRFFHGLIPIPREYILSQATRTLLYGGAYKKPNTTVWKPY